MTIEKIECKIKVKIKDVDGKVIDLKKDNVPFEVNFEKGQSGNAKSEPKLVEFEKDGKKYKVIVELKNVGKRWFDYYVVWAEVKPAEGEEFITWTSIPDLKSGKSPWSVISTTKRSFGWIVVSVIITLLLIGGIIGFIIWKRKK
ncbi:hypothetical protein [endosymbiont GvMRE of Glomus versiforme]|uniref:hypothetical protein n=1 Tax=endosymbiont GvMRE of Glomus versiforme TaxID=2039283 RepID=UPI000EC02DD5|nr:hypothetical protein [endosymbiont GvMRE of Glomus versiforme]RHZ36751.1 hypothetical protein GvMRE_I2g362 [endosymbiont GvMRE of Glomus versiforme]